MDAGRLLLDKAAVGDWNMAVDEALMSSAAESGLVTLRCYRWAKPTLSLGYFQSIDERSTHVASRECDWVRRHSGGGAILHHYDVTYSLALPASFTPPNSSAPRGTNTTAEWVYRIAHDAVISVLRSMHIEATRFGELEVSEQNREASDASARQPQPFLCFQRRTHDDLVIGDSKVLGSAQRRRAGALLQHGSILWARSEFAPELPGIAELTGQTENVDEWQSWSALFTDAFAPELFASLGISFQLGELTEQEHRHAKAIRGEKYGSEQWNCRR